MAAAAVGVELKVLDNFLAREGSSLIPPGRQGRSRVIPLSTLETVALTFLLVRDGGFARSVALSLARDLAASPQGEVRLGALGRLRYDVTGLRRVLQHAVSDAWEENTPRPRGRPRRKTERGVR